MTTENKEKSDLEEIAEDISADVPIQERKGAFAQSLVRNLKTIRADRAQVILEDAELTYKRVIEDMRVDIKRLKRDRDGMIDLAPDSALSLKLPTDFDSKEFTQREIDIGVKIRELEIKLEIAEARYVYLFAGGE